MKWLLYLNALVWGACVVLILYALMGCKSITSCVLLDLEDVEPIPADTKFDESKRDWIEVYHNEVRIAIENGDFEAYHFFMQELIKEKVRLWREKQKNNP